MSVHYKLARKIDNYFHKVANLNNEKLKQLSQIPSFAGRIKFCQENFIKLKAGSSRIGFEYSSELILKLAKNEKGIAQNSTEADGFMQQGYKHLVANVVDSDPNDLWIVAERATKITPSQFKILTRYSLDELKNFLYKKFNNNMKHIDVPNYDKMNEDEFIGDIIDMMSNFDMPVGDIVRISSWGKVKDKAVLIDYGITNSIMNDYY